MSTLAPGLVDALRMRYRLDLDSAEPLAGGYDVWATSWRLETSHGPFVLRADRSVSPETAAWISDVIQHGGEAGAPCSPALRAVDGTVAFRVADATVTLRPFVEGRCLERDDAVQLRAAGATLALLHRALAGTQAQRPVPSPWDPRCWSGDHDPSTLQDADLDGWHEAFMQRRDGALAQGVIHGDFWADNLVWADGRVAAVIDWCEARVDVLARELAWSTWEFGHDGTSRDLDIDRARTFLTGYRAVRGPWEPGLAEILIPLMRVELRLHARYSLADPGDGEYNTALQHAFGRLRDQSAAVLLDV